MNESHLLFLASPEWARMLEAELLPWIEAAGNLGDDVLEIGPGPGLTTDLLRQRVRRVTAVEIDPSLGEPLRDRLGGTNVDVIVENDDLTISKYILDHLSHIIVSSWPGPMTHHRLRVLTNPIPRKEDPSPTYFGLAAIATGKKAPAWLQ